MMDFKRCRAHVFLALLMMLAAYSCRNGQVDNREFPLNGVFKGRLSDGRTLFVVRSADSLSVSGYAFLYDGTAVVSPVSFKVDSTGVLRFGQESDSLMPDLKLRRTLGGRLRLTVPHKNVVGWERQKIRLEYFYTLDDGSRYVIPYRDEICKDVIVHSDVEYGRASGYYSSQPTDTISIAKMDLFRKLIVKDLARSMARRTEVPLHMDVYEPDVESPSLRPVVVFLHGGAFMFGDKRNSLQHTMTDYLVRRGYVVASVNYRLGISFGGLFSVERTIYRGVQDVREAMSYLIEHADEYRIDINQIYLSGNSAGAILSLTTAFMDADEVFDSVKKRIGRDDLGALEPAPNSDSEKFDIAGVVSMWGGLIDTVVITERDRDIPVLLFHGTADDIVPCESGLPFQVGFDSWLYDRLSESWRLYGSAPIYRHMQSMHMPVSYVAFPGYGHEPQQTDDGGVNENMATILDSTGVFLYSQVARHYAPCELKKVAGRSEAVYALEGSCRPVVWLVDGGIVVEQSDRQVSVAWFAGREKHTLRAVVMPDEADVYYEKSFDEHGF